MNVFALLAAGKNALKKGEILAHPERWKSLQVLTMALVALGTSIYQVLCALSETCYGFTANEVTAYATSGAAILFGGYQIWSTIATSKKIGFGKQGADLDLDSADRMSVPPDATGRSGSDSSGDSASRPFGY